MQFTGALVAIETLGHNHEAVGLRFGLATWGSRCASTPGCTPKTRFAFHVVPVLVSASPRDAATIHTNLPVDEAIGVGLAFLKLLHDAIAAHRHRDAFTKLIAV